jgi:hypothetical protein
VSRRDHISNTTKLAAALCVILDIPHEHQLLMTAEQVLSLVQWDHWPIRRDDGLKLGMMVGEVDGFANLFARPIMAHREKTATIDQPQMAKSRHIRVAQAEHQAAMASKFGQFDTAKWSTASAAETLKPGYRWPSRKIPSRPMRSQRRQA